MHRVSESCLAVFSCTNEECKLISVMVQHMSFPCLECLCSSSVLNPGVSNVAIKDWLCSSGAFGDVQVLHIIQSHRFHKDCRFSRCQGCGFGRRVAPRGVFFASVS